MEASSVPAPAPRPEKKPSALKGGLAEAGEMTIFFWQALRALPGVPRFASEALRQAGVLIRGSTLFIFLMVIYIGVAETSFAYLFLRSAGAGDFLGFFTGISTPRAAVPIMFGYAFAAKVGCGLVAEIGAAKINEEVDALESEGVDPMRYVVGTRLIGALIFVPLAVVVALLAAAFGIWIDGVYILQALPTDTLMDAHWGSQTIQDQFLCLINLATMGMGIVIVSCYFGYRASGGPAGVGKAVAASIVVNLVLVHVVAAFYISLFYAEDLQLPIGG